MTTGDLRDPKPRIGLFQRYGGGNMDEGWTRLLFERFDIPFTTVMDKDIKAGDLDVEVRRDRAACGLHPGHDR